ncbi:MAG TPA: amino acid permease [Chitinophagaceae bacterium]|nr:amino acid permease [Chitinophagaceae bacterium]
MTNDKTSLNRALGLTASTLLVAGLMIGSGVFKKVVPMAKSLGSEPYILLAWIMAGVITMFGAFTYAGLATTTNRTGGIYEYLKIAFGDFIAFLFGWSFFTITGSGAIAALAFIFSQSVNTLAPLPFGDAGVKGFAVVVIGLLTWLNYRGIKQGGIVNSIVTTAKILGILLLIAASLFFTHGTSVEQGTPVASAAITGAAYFSSFFGAMLSALWAYDGWANITFIAGEVKNPERNLPLAIVGGVGIAMFLYVMLNYGFMQVLSLHQLAGIGDNQIAAAEAANAVMGRTGAVIISILIMTCTFGAANACIIVYPRLYYRMAQENRFFKRAAAVQPVFRTPHISLLYSGIWCSVLVISGTFDLLTNLVVLASYFFFGLTAWGLIKMKKRGIVKAKVVGYPVTPYIIILFSIVLIINNIIHEPKESLACIALIFSGIPFYIYFKRKDKAAVALK